MAMTNEISDREQVGADPFRNGKGSFVQYGGSAVGIPLKVHVRTALGVRSGDQFWYRIAADNRSITIHLDNPNGNDKKTARSHAASKGR